MKKIFLVLMMILLTGCQNQNTNGEAINVTPEVTQNQENVTQEEVVEEVVVEVVYDDAVDGQYITDGSFELGHTLIRFPSKDDAMITGDLNLIDHTSPMVILFHQATYSRGEYIETAQKLNELGYNTLAVDQRSGDIVNDIENMTYKRLYAQSTKVYGFKDAIIDVEATLEYASESFDMPLVALGSSYSASILCVVGQNYADDLSGLILFSPGENMVFDGNKVSDMASNLMLPVFLSCGSHESYEPEIILEKIPSETKVMFMPKRVPVHGSTLLWAETEKQDEVWEAMMTYISALEL